MKEFKEAMRRSPRRSSCGPDERQWRFPSSASGMSASAAS